MSLRRAVFLDRDGTLNVDFGYVRDPERVEIIPGAIRGAKALADAGFLLVVTSNQSGVARGLLTEAQANAVDAKIGAEFAAAGAPIAAFYRCPHLPDGSVATYACECDCRKPKPGLLLRAANDHRIDLSRSWTVGDQARDITAGKAAGCRSVLVAAQAATSQGPTTFEAVEPEYRAGDLVDAARYIIKHS